MFQETAFLHQRPNKIVELNIFLAFQQQPAKCAGIFSVLLPCCREEDLVC